MYRILVIASHGIGRRMLPHSASCLKHFGKIWEIGGVFFLALAFCGALVQLKQNTTKKH